MAKNMVFLVHKTNGSVIYTNSKSDLATILGVSLRTIMRNYSNVGMYESMHYIIYIGVEKYNNGKQYNYNHIIEPPAVKAYSSSNSPTIANKSDSVSHSNRNIEHVVDIESWKEIEDNLLSYQQEKYYLDRTLEQLYLSYERYKFSDKQRAAIISKIGAKKQLDR